MLLIKKKKKFAISQEQAYKIQKEQMLNFILMEYDKLGMKA